MKKLLVALFSLIIVSVQAQTADDVIQKYAANMGGLEAFNKITSLKMTGTVSTQGMDLPLTVQIINGKAMRSDIEAMGQTISNAYSNGIAWKINPLQGSSTATTATGAELSEFKSQTLLASQLMDYKARGHAVELLGEETIDGVKASKIKFTNKDDGKVTTYYISTKDYVLIKSLSTKEVRGEQAEITTMYSDLKEFNGVKFFMTRSMQMNGEEFQAMMLSKIELNVPVDEKIFEMPK